MPDLQTLRSQLFDVIEQINVDEDVPTWKPIHDRVIVYPLGDGHFEKTTAAGLIIPGEDRPHKSVVMVVNDNLHEQINVGDVIVTGKYIGEPVSFGGVNYRMVRECDILAVLDEE